VQVRSQDAGRSRKQGDGNSRRNNQNLHVKISIPVEADENFSAV
jgi:hypothetical protein